MIKSEVKKIICKVNGKHDMVFIARYWTSNKRVLKCKHCGYIKEEMDTNFRLVDSGTYNKKTGELEPLKANKIEREKKEKAKWLDLLFKIKK